MGIEYVFPLLSALIYVAGVLFLKRAAELGTDVWRISAVCNFYTAIAFAPLWLLGGNLPSWELWWQAALVGALYVIGQTVAFVALRIGDVSIATPVLGVKILLVAFFTTLLLSEQLRPALWIAAVLSSVAIALLNRTRAASHDRVGMTILMSGSAAATFALFDVLVQKWSPAWGTGRFLPVMMGFVGFYSIGLWAFGTKSERATAQTASRACFIAGAICLAVQSVLFISTVSLRGHATAANVLYSSRGLWSVLAVWLVGHWFDNRERHLGARIMAWRLSGAALMLTAIALVLLG